MHLSHQVHLAALEQYRFKTIQKRMNLESFFQTYPMTLSLQGMLSGLKQIKHESEVTVVLILVRVM